MKLCFLAPSGFGKSTAVKLLGEIRESRNIKIAEPLYDLQKKFYESIAIDIGDKQDGELLQFFGEKVRKENKYFLLDEFKKKLRKAEKENVLITNDDCRPADYQFLKDLGFLFVRIEGYRRDRDDHRKADNKNKLEWQAEIPCDFVLKNFGSIDEYKKNIENLLMAAEERLDKCYIFPSTVCNCDCSICISKTRDFSDKPEKLLPDEMDESLKLLAKRGIHKFEITGGGDPFMNTGLCNIIEKIRYYIPDAYIKLYTNGQILTPIQFVNEINISVASFDDEINDKFMGCKHKESFIERIKFWRKTADNCFYDIHTNLRLSIAVMKGGIDSPEKLKSIIELTKDYVDEYVVRTLYKGCPNYDDMFVDFEYEHPCVKWERNNTGKGNNLIMGTDGFLYSDFELTNKSYLHPYLMLKPDAAPHINEIIKMIEEAGFDIKKMLCMENFSNQAPKLYYLKHPSYLSLVKKHIDLTSKLFGDNAIVILLDKAGSMESIMLDIVQLKSDIRHKFGLTHAYGGHLDIDGGHYQLNIAHCPDAKREYYDKDLFIIEQMKLEKIDEEKINNMKRYCTFHLK